MKKPIEILEDSRYRNDIESPDQIITVDLEHAHIGDDGAAAFGAILANLPKLTTLKLKGNKISSKGAAALAAQLKNAPMLSRVDLADNNIGDDGTVAIAAQLVVAPQLTTLNLSKNNIGDTGITALANQLVNATKLRILKLESNDIGLEGITALADQLQNASQLIELYLGFNGIGPIATGILVDKLKKTPQLTALYLPGNNLGDDGAITVASQLKNAVQLNILDLGQNHIHDKGAAALAEQLRNTPQITTLLLKINYIGLKGIAALSAQLVNTPQLNCLGLGWNKIGDKGVAVLAEHLVNAPKLRTLNLGSNDIGPKGIAALADQLINTPQLTTLILEFNKIGPTGTAILASQLHNAPQLVTLNIKGNKLGPSGAAALAAQLHKQPHLAILNIGFNFLGDEGATILAAKLKNAPLLTELNLAGNDIGAKGVSNIAAQLVNLPQLKTLYLDNNNIDQEGIDALAAQLVKLTQITKVRLLCFAHINTEKISQILDRNKKIQANLATANTLTSTYESLPRSSIKQQQVNLLAKINNHLDQLYQTADGIREQYDHIPVTLYDNYYALNTRLALANGDYVTARSCAKQMSTPPITILLPHAPRDPNLLAFTLETLSEHLDDPAYLTLLVKLLPKLKAPLSLPSEADNFRLSLLAAQQVDPIRNNDDIQAVLRLYTAYRDVGSQASYQQLFEQSFVESDTSPPFDDPKQDYIQSQLSRLIEQSHRQLFINTIAAANSASDSDQPKTGQDPGADIGFFGQPRSHEQPLSPELLTTLFSDSETDLSHTINELIIMLHTTKHSAPNAFLDQFVRQLSNELELTSHLKQSEQNDFATRCDLLCTALKELYTSPTKQHGSQRGQS